eukprot:6690277-Alexandrium_andersonii.AAC.1
MSPLEQPVAWDGTPTGSPDPLVKVRYFTGTLLGRSWYQLAQWAKLSSPRLGIFKSRSPRLMQIR